jgi:hypothetical protein
MSDYALTKVAAFVRRTADNADVPVGIPDNRDSAAYDAWLAAGNTPDPYVAPPALPSVLSFLDFMALFTADEQAAIVNATDTQVKLFVLQASGAGDIDLGDARVIRGVNYLAATGIITAGRASAILVNQAPV